MSLAAVHTATKSNVNHLQNHPSTQSKISQPSLHSAQAQLTPTQTEEADQLTGSHTQVQTLDAQADISNPLTSQRLNAQVATSGV